MPELELDTWLRPDDLSDKEDTTIVFLSEGEIKSADFQGRPTEVFEIKISIGKEEKLWTMNKTSQRAVSSMYSNNTAKWVGKKAVLFLADQNVEGKMKKVIYARVSV